MDFDAEEGPAPAWAQKKLDLMAKALREHGRKRGPALKVFLGLDNSGA